MAKNINLIQFRYYNDGNANNYPKNSTKELFMNGSFLGDITHIVQFGIQTLSGVKFSLNGSDDYITVGKTGVYEIELTDDVTISDIHFFEESLQLINDNSTAYLILDLAYESHIDTAEANE